MRIHVLAPATPWERRVAVIPDSARRLMEQGHEVSIDPNVGVDSGYPDDDYRALGVSVGRPDGVDLLVCVEAPTSDAAAGGRSVLGLLDPLGGAKAVQKLAQGGAALLSFELVPRTTRAQTVDVLSSQASLAGYQATLEAATRCDRIFPMLTTAAGTIRPARVLVLGAGVAGLQAIATARRLGAMVHGFDVRTAAAEQVESLGATFVSVDVEPQDAATAGGYAQELEKDTETRLLNELFPHVEAADAVITTAAIPGKAAPLLVSAAMVEAMRFGSVVVDGAAATGGNCEVSRAGETVVVDGVSISAPLDLPSRSANHASQLFGRNVVNFVSLLSGEDGSLDLDVEDDIVQAATVARNGEVVHDRVRAALDERN